MKLEIVLTSRTNIRKKEKSMKKRIFMTGVVVLVGLSLMAFQGLPPLDDPCAVLEWLGTSAGVALVAGAVISWLVENIPTFKDWWASLLQWHRRGIMLGLCLILPVLSLLGRVGMCGVELTRYAIYAALVAGLLAFAGGTFAHTRLLIRGGRR